MKIDEIIKKKPHLKETLELYMKIRDFKEMDVEEPDEVFPEELPYSRDDLKRSLSSISSIFDIGPESLGSLKSAIVSGRIRLREMPMDAELPDDLSFEEEDLITLLFLISKPFFLSERKRLNLDGVFWDEGRCPICNSIPAISVIGKEEKRRFCCSYCETIGPWRRIGCPNCLSEKAEDITIITLDGEAGMRVDACEKCRHYYKSFDTQMLTEYSPDLLDLISLPLDIVAQGKGYSRSAPNPVGMIRMG